EHLLHAGRRLEVALVDGGVARTRPAQLLARPAARDRHQPERRGRAAVVVEPRVAALVVLHQLGGVGTERGLEPALPQVGRFDDVGVARVLGAGGRIHRSSGGGEQSFVWGAFAYQTTRARGKRGGTLARGPCPC